MQDFPGFYGKDIIRLEEVHPAEECELIRQVVDKRAYLLIVGHLLGKPVNEYLQLLPGAAHNGASVCKAPLPNIHDALLALPDPGRFNIKGRDTILVLYPGAGAGIAPRPLLVGKKIPPGIWKAVNVHDLHGQLPRFCAL